MKLIIAIVSNDDSAAVTSTLTEHGFFITKLSTTGGFLRAGNTTFLLHLMSDTIHHIQLKFRLGALQSLYWMLNSSLRHNKKASQEAFRLP